MRLRLKSCPRCGGDLRVDRDWKEWYEQCIQCGYLGFLEELAASGSLHSNEAKESPYGSDGRDHGVAEGMGEPVGVLCRRGLGTN